MKHSEKVKLFERIQRDYSKMLQAVIWRLCGQKELFADAYQNAQLAIWKHIDKLDGGHAGTYLYKVAMSAVTIAWRAKDTRGTSLEIASEEIGQSHEADNSDPAQKAIDSEEFIALRELIALLPIKQSQAISMRYLLDMDYSEIAGQLGCSESVVRTNVTRGIASIRKKMKVTFVKEPDND